MFRALAILSLLLISFSTPAFAKELYVDGTSGNDSVSYAANSASSPWRTIGRAAWGSTNRNSPNASQAAQPGDTVIVRSGTYSTTATGIRYDPAYNPINSGTSGAPIVFEASGTVILTQTGTGPLIGANGIGGRRDYITWRGFTINEIDALATADTGPVVLWATTGSRIEDCTINGFDNGRLGDNHNGIRIEDTTDVVLRNNLIFNVLNFGGYHHNGGAIMAYASRGALIEHNEIYNSGSGIFVKQDNRDFVVRNNYVHNNGTGIMIGYTDAQGEHRIYQNLVVGNQSGISVTLNSANVRIVNNTVVGNDNGFNVAWCDNTIDIQVLNNIFANSGNEGIYGTYCGTHAPLTLDYNLYHNNVRGWSIANQRYTSLSAWRTATGGDEQNSFTADPRFLDTAGRDFRLQSSSPAIGAGRDILDLNRNGSTSDQITLGAFILGDEVIGRFSGVQPAAPRSPDGVTIE